jgi:hypothetical protein
MMSLFALKGETCRSFSPAFSVRAAPDNAVEARTCLCASTAARGQVAENESANHLPRIDRRFRLFSWRGPPVTRQAVN